MKRKVKRQPLSFSSDSYLLVQIDVKMLDSSLGSLLQTLWTGLGWILWIVMLFCGHFKRAFSDTSSGSEKAN